MSEINIIPDVKYLGYNKAKEARTYACPFCSGDILIHKPNFYGQCLDCKATYVDYDPLPHQQEFHKSTAKYRLNLGGYGTGKTTMCCAEVAEHVLSTPNGRTLITAPKLQQVRDAVLPELEKFLPPWLMTRQVKGNTPSYTMANGHEIVVYASNDEQNLRSLNLTMFYIEEASNVDYTVFTQLQARLRNAAGLVTDEFDNILEDNTYGLISSNPEQGWLVTDFLLLCKEIHASPNVSKDGYEKLKKSKVYDTYAAFLSSSRDNKFLRPGFIEELCINKSRSWIAQFIDCSLETRQGAVYPDFLNCLVDPFPIPKHWKRIIGFDKGIKDPTAWIIGAIDPKTFTIYFYQEYAVPDQPVSYHAQNFKIAFEGLPMYNRVQADPSILQRSDRDGRSYQDYFYRLTGVMLDLANNSIEQGIYKVRDYMYLGKIKFFRDLQLTKDEAIAYIFKEREGKETPSEINNHLMDCLRYAVMALPDNPHDFTPFSIASGFLGGLTEDEMWLRGGYEEQEEELGIYNSSEIWG